VDDAGKDFHPQRRTDADADAGEGWSWMASA